MDEFNYQNPQNMARNYKLAHIQNNPENFNYENLPQGKNIEEKRIIRKAKNTIENKTKQEEYSPEPNNQYRDWSGLY